MRTLLFLLLVASAASGQDEPLTPLKPRPELGAEAYAAEVAKLRAAYAQPVAEWPKPTIDANVKFVELGPLPTAKHPDENPYSKEKADLGKALFFDARLSGSGQIACASCHDPDLAWSDGRTTSFGHARKPLKRNSPSIMNAAFQPVLFWDGRAATLEEQARKVLGNPDEMRADEKQFAERLATVKGYPEAFVKVYGDATVNLDRVTKAIACFERTVVGGKSRFDQLFLGNAKPLSDSEIRGLHLFRTDARCANCHHGPLFSDGQLHNIGLNYYGRKFEDLGRYDVTKDNADTGKFRTPSLRNIGRTGPYMHNGLFEIDEVLRLYNAGMPTIRRTERFKDDPRFPIKSALLKPLGLNKQDLADLQAFLFSLSEPIRKVRLPELGAVGS